MPYYSNMVTSRVTASYTRCVQSLRRQPAFALFKATGALPPSERRRSKSNDGDGSAAKAVFVLMRCPCSYMCI